MDNMDIQLRETIQVTKRLSLLAHTQYLAILAGQFGIKGTHSSHWARICDIIAFHKRKSEPKNSFFSLRLFWTYWVRLWVFARRGYLIRLLGKSSCDYSHGGRIYLWTRKDLGAILSRSRGNLSRKSIFLSCAPLLNLLSSSVLL